MAQSLLGVLALGAVTFACLRLQVNSSVTVCLYLILVVLVSLAGSFLPSVVVSLFAAGCLDYYFVPPLHSFEVGEPLNQLAVVAFLTASAVVTVLAQRLHRAGERPMLTWRVEGEPKNHCAAVKRIWRMRRG